jgi:hypothetical protein
MDLVSASGGSKSFAKTQFNSDSDLNRGSLLWYAIQPLFEQTDSDVLLLLDCCAAASGAPTASESISVTETGNSV